MIRLIAVAGFALTVATAAQAMSPAPLHLPDGITTKPPLDAERVEHSWWCLRGQDHQTPSPQSRPQVCSMARRRLRSVLLIVQRCACGIVGQRRASRSRCPSRKSHARVATMQSAHDGYNHDSPRLLDC